MVREQWREDLTREQWRIARALNDFFRTQDAIPLFIGHFAKAATLGNPRGETKDVDAFVYDEATLLPKAPDVIFDLAEKAAERFRASSPKLEQYAVRLTFESVVGDSEIELFHCAEGLDPQPHHLERSVEFNGLRVVCPEDWIIFKLEAVYDRTATQGAKHEADLREVAHHLRETGQRLNLQIVLKEIGRREKRKQADMRARFFGLFPEYLKST